jgi:NADH:ubiquinone oxidoreductase subunit 5 (subunit L)/multisubunit Na+/H+ antiporter MnhA subunit
LLWQWLEIGALEIPIALKVDALATMMILVITGVGTLIHIYAIGYMHGDPRFPRFFVYLNLFLASMLVLVLPDAMAGPTPVSALIHAATMVTAGVYMIARSEALYNLAPLTQSIVAWIGGVTALFAATIAVAQWDMKRVMAYSTISQLAT